MAALHAQPIDYGRVLADLQAKRDDIEAAIRAIEAIYAPNNVNHVAHDTASHEGIVSLKIPRKMGFYDAACYILERAGMSMSSPDMLEAFSQAGRKVDGRSISTLYRAMKEKGDDCKIRRVGEGKQGKWALVEWENEKL